VRTPCRANNTKQFPWRKKIDAATPEVFAFLSLGAFVLLASSGGVDPARNAMQQCWKVSQYCQLYAVDNTVV
jgi:hypothetical protein